MHRGYRGIILAAVGWLILAATPSGNISNTEQHHSQQEIANTLSQIANSLNQAKEPERETVDCSEGRDRKYDLCAQWKAADAAKQAADAADRTVTIGWIGLTLAAITMGAAIAAAIFAREAARHTDRGADEAGRAAKAAEDALAEVVKCDSIQLRPYVTFTHSDPDDLDKRLDFRPHGRFNIAVKNFGQTPARKIWIHRGTGLFTPPIRNAEAEFNEPTEEVGQLAPGDHRNIVFYLTGFNESTFEDVRAGKQTLLIRIKVEYEIGDDGARDFDDVTMVVSKRLLDLGPGTHRISNEHREAT